MSTAHTQNGDKHDLVLLPVNGKGNHLYLIRGVPGSGKTTLAKKVVEWYDCICHLESDMYFERTGQYVFDREKLYAAHNWCQTTVQVLLNQGKRVVVSNTFTTYREMEPYVKYAKLNGIGVTLITMTKEYGSIHDVPEETMIKMRERFESHKDIREKIVYA